MQQQGRLRLRAWLEKQIHSGEYPGVKWLDQAAQIFQIPWKHAARHGWSIDRDATLFRSWAIHTGRYQPGKDRPDPKTWKANFRCALNSLSDVCELREHSKKKGTNAYRVYRMLPNKTVKRKRGSTSGRRSSRSRSLTTNRDNVIQPWQPLRSAQNPAQKERGGEYHENATSFGMSTEIDEQEQKEAVFKLMDQLNNIDNWSQTYEPRAWRMHSLENHWHWSAEDNTAQMESYCDFFPNHIKELNDWPLYNQTLMQ